jgi:nucleotide-binding universal stress UspA family protein
MTTQALIPEQQAEVSLKNILLATDFSEASEKAFNYAVAMARRHGSKISLVHVIPPQSESFASELQRQRHEAERQLESVASRSQLHRIQHETLVRVGSVWEVLSTVIQQQDIDLVVIGTHGRSGLKKLVLGSVAEEVVRRAGCPVLTVGPHIDAILSLTGEFHTILFATDFHCASEKALNHALLHAGQPDAKLILLHVMPPTAFPGTGASFYQEGAINQWQANVKASVREKLRKLLPLGISLCFEPEYVVAFDFCAEGILQVAAARKADLIIMGARRPALVKVSAHSPGAISYAVIRRANCPVLTTCG